MALLFISDRLRFKGQYIRINTLLHCVFLLSHLAVASGEINSRLYRVCLQMMSGNTQVMLANCLRSRGVFGLLSRFAFARLTIILVRCGSAFLESSDFAVNVRKHVSVRLILHDVSRQTGFYSVLHLAVSTGTPLGWYRLVRAGHRFRCVSMAPSSIWSRVRR